MRRIWRRKSCACLRPYSVPESRPNKREENPYFSKIQRNEWHRSENRTWYKPITITYGRRNNRRDKETKKQQQQRNKIKKEKKTKY